MLGFTLDGEKWDDVLTAWYALPGPRGVGGTITKQGDPEMGRLAKQAALAGVASYHIVEDSNLIRYLKLDDYGFVAQERAGERTPMNLGVELPEDVLSAAWESAQGKFA